MPPRSRSQPAVERQIDIHQTITLTPPAPEPAAARRSLEVPLSASSSASSSARIQAALAAGTRTEASLSGLMQAVQDLSRGVSSARDANEQLVHELDTLRRLLEVSGEEQRTLKQRLAALEHEREHERRQDAVDKTRLQDQYDAFLADLIGDHEQALDELRRERDAAQERIAVLEARMLSLSTLPPPSSGRAAASALEHVAGAGEELLRLQASLEKLGHERERTREALHRLQQQRDEAQTQAAKALRERDEARAEADLLRAEMARAQRVASTRPPAARGSGNLSMRRTDPPPRRRESTPPLGQPIPTLGQPALELDLPPARGGKPSTPPQTLPAHRAGSRPPLRPKPDPSSRPLIGYSLRDSVAPESLGTLRNPSKPPKT
jgi:hypothetical protein